MNLIPVIESLLPTNFVDWINYIYIYIYIFHILLAIYKQELVAE